MPRSLSIGFEDAMDPVMIRHDPDPRLKPASGISETVRRSTDTPLKGSMVRTDPSDNPTTT